MGMEWFKRPTLAPDYNQRPIENLSVSGSTLSLFGISTIRRKTSAGASTCLYTLPAPKYPGISKYIVVLAATSTRTCRVTANSAAILTTASTSAGAKITFNKGNAFATLLSISTTVWAAQVQSGTVA